MKTAEKKDRQMTLNHKDKAHFDQWIGEMLKAEAEQSRVNKINAPIKLKNAQRKAKNIERKEQGEEELPPLPMEAKLTEWSLERLQREISLRRDQKNITPEEWATRIEALEEPLRTRVACLVWWDFFAQRIVSQRWANLDPYLRDQGYEVPSNTLVDGMHTVGYTPLQAFRRVKKNEDASESVAA